MEPASLCVGVVGLVGLVSACLDVLDKVDTYKTFSSDSRSLLLCFEADKQRFRRWLHDVGFVNGRLIDGHHPLLDDATLKPLVHKILSRMCNIWGTGSAMLSAMELADLDTTNTLSRSGSSMSATQKPQKPIKQMLASKRVKVGWALGGKAKFITQLESFEALVNRLYSLIPPSGLRGGASSDSAATFETDKDTQEDAALTENRRLMSEMRDYLRQEGQRAVNRWLGAAMITNHHFDKCLTTRLANTCDWILEKSTFLDWLSPDFPDNTAKMLWINGPAGYGKTILCAHIIEHLKSLGQPASPSTSPPSSTTLAYFFFSSDIESRGDPLLIVRSWISQLVSGHPEGLKAALAYVPANEAGTATPTEIWELFSVIVRSVPQCTLVVDGLDECAVSRDPATTADDNHFSNQNRRTRFITDLKQAVAHTSTRVLVVSRDEFDIRSELRPVGGGNSSIHRGIVAAGEADRDIEVDNQARPVDDGDDDDAAAGAPVTHSEWRVTGEDVRSDVGLFARSVVRQQLPKRDAGLCADLAAQMADKCDGMFLWIRLQQKRLRGSLNRKRLLDAVQQVPPGLEHLYDRNWSEITQLEGHDRCRAVAILRWTTFALRPLTVAEITEALAFVDDDDCDDLRIDELPDAVDEEYVENEIVDICRSLVEVRSEGPSDGSVASHTLHLVHFSVRQYLMSAIVPPGLLAIDRVSFSEEAAQHAHLARLCLRYLLFRRVWESNRQSPFLVYAAFAWYRHPIPSTGDDQEFNGLVNRLFDSRYPCWALWQDFRQRRIEDRIGTAELEYQLHGSRLYSATALGLLGTTEILCGPLPADLNDASGYLGTPLQASAALGFLPVVRLLLDRGAAVNAPGGPFGSALNAATANQQEDIVSFLLQCGADVTMTDPADRTALYLACQGGCTRFASILLESGSSVSKVDKEGRAPLHVAAEKSIRPLVELLLDRGADPKMSDAYGQTPLYSAARGGQTEVAKALLSRGASLLETDKVGCTPLHSAAESGHLDLVREFLQQGADPETVCEFGWTPLSVASMSGNVEVVKLLLERGANLATSDKCGRTPLMPAARLGHVQVVRFLLEQGADHATVDSDGLTSLHAASMSGNVEVVKLLVERGASLTMLDKYGRTPLMPAARLGHIEVVRFLFERGANHATADMDGWTPLHAAAMSGNVEVVKLLLQRGAGLATSDKYGRTALLPAARSGNVDVVKLLLKQGADPATANVDGWTPLHDASMSGKVEIVKLLLEHGAGLTTSDKYARTALLPAARSGHIEVVKLLLERGADHATADVDGRTPLHAASMTGNVEMVKFLPEMGVNQVTANVNGWTPLHDASLSGNVEVVKILVEQGADISHADKYGVTPLSPAIQHGHTEVVEFFLERGADVETVDDYGTPLLLATAYGHHEVLKLLLERGANVDSVSCLGETALHVAYRKRLSMCVQVLMKYGASALIPDSFGRTTLDWAHVADVAEIPLARISNKEWDPVSDRRKLRKAVVQLAKYVQSKSNCQVSRAYTLGYALLYLGDIARARHLFEEILTWHAFTIRCDGCDVVIEESLHVCKLCFQRDFCDHCLGKDGGRSQLGWCREHDLLGVTRPAESNGEQIADRPSIDEWLARLILTYTVDEEGAK